jgi:hypothetical protein
VLASSRSMVGDEGRCRCDGLLSLAGQPSGDETVLPRAASELSIYPPEHGEFRVTTMPLWWRFGHCLTVPLGWERYTALTIFQAEPPNAAVDESASIHQQCQPKSRDFVLPLWFRIVYKARRYYQRLDLACIRKGCLRNVLFPTQM